MPAPDDIYKNEVDFTALALQYPQFAKRSVGPVIYLETHEDNLCIHVELMSLPHVIHTRKSFANLSSFTRSG
jgi:hypothetical protein